MPVRTVTEEFCDVCFADEKSKETPATDRVRFSWLGRNYVLLACAKHIDKIRGELQHLSEIGSLEAGPRRGAARPGAARPTRAGGKTLFSQLSAEEKERFRAWAGMPTARRIADSRVDAWKKAGKP